MPNQFFREMQFLVIPDNCYCFINGRLHWSSHLTMTFLVRGFVKDQTTDHRTALKFQLILLKWVCSLQFKLLLCCKIASKMQILQFIYETLCLVISISVAFRLVSVFWLSYLLYCFLSIPFNSAGCGSHRSKYNCILNGRQAHHLNHDSIMKQ